MNPLDMFDEKKPMRRFYLPPPTSQKILPIGMKGLDRFFSEPKTKKGDSAKQ